MDALADPAHVYRPARRNIHGQGRPPAIGRQPIDVMLAGRQIVDVAAVDRVVTDRPKRCSVPQGRVEDPGGVVARIAMTGQ